MKERRVAKLPTRPEEVNPDAPRVIPRTVTLEAHNLAQSIHPDNKELADWQLVVLLELSMVALAERRVEHMFMAEFFRDALKARALISELKQEMLVLRMTEGNMETKAKNVLHDATRLSTLELASVRRTLSSKLRLLGECRDTGVPVS